MRSRAVVAALTVFCSSMGLFAADIEAFEAEAERDLNAADPVMGDYSGDWELSDGSDYGTCAAQVIAMGKGKYRIKLIYRFDARMDPIAVLDAAADGSAVTATGTGTYDDRSLDMTVRIADGKMTGTFDAGEGRGTFTLNKTYRISPTMGLKPPKNAVVLFRKKADAARWKHPRKPENADEIKWVVKNDSMQVKPGTGSIISRDKFQDIKLHMEFRSPFMPEARGQGRGNSGVYLQGRYEVQILDSYGLEGADNECGGIYKVGRPIVNMCAPPMQWQTYDIIFHAPVFDATGKKVKDANITVKHNGVRIQQEIDIPGATTAALGGDPKTAEGIYLQDHGNAVEFRNIWVVELPAEQ